MRRREEAVPAVAVLFPRRPPRPRRGSSVDRIAQRRRPLGREVFRDPSADDSRRRRRGVAASRLRGICTSQRRRDFPTKSQRTSDEVSDARAAASPRVVRRSSRTPASVLLVEGVVRRHEAPPRRPVRRAAGQERLHEVVRARLDVEHEVPAGGRSSNRARFSGDSKRGRRLLPKAVELSPNGLRVAAPSISSCRNGARTKRSPRRSFSDAGSAQRPARREDLRDVARGRQ